MTGRKVMSDRAGVNFYCERALREQIDEAAQARGVTMSELMRRAVVAYLAELPLLENRVVILPPEPRRRWWRRG